MNLSKMGSRVQYAQLPKFKYQSFEPKYQTFDPRTLQLSSYPVTSALASSVRLTPGKVQGNYSPYNAETNNEQVDDSPPEPGGK